MRPCAEYVEQYRAGLRDTAGPMANYLLPDSYALDGNRLLMTHGKPLHPNARLLAETIWQLQPRSVAEFGCGYAANLYNVSLLLPQAKLYGFEWCAEQIALSREVFPSLKADLRQQDITQPLDAPRVDVAFSHVALMHLDGTAATISAIKSMFALARRQVVMLENWTAFDFTQSIPADWHIYIRHSPEFKRNHILIASKTVLDYAPLKDYQTELVEPVKANWQSDYLAFGSKDWQNA